MADDKNQSNLPAYGGEFAHTFTREGETHGAGIIAIPFMIVAFMFFTLIAILMLIAGGASLLLGKPGKFDFKYSLNKSRDMFGGKTFTNALQRDDNVIDVEATEICEKEIDGH